MRNIFVSYTNSDREWAHWIAVERRAQGHKPHVHEWEIDAGGNILGWTEQHHDAANHVLYGVSKECLKAPHSIQELPDDAARQRFREFMTPLAAPAIVAFPGGPVVAK